MNYKKYIELVSGIVFLATAIYHVTIDKPAIYVLASVFGFMFLFQGISKLRKNN